MWSVAGWELRVFIPVERLPTAQLEEGEGEEEAVLDVFRWAKRYKKDLKAKWKKEEEEKRKKSKKDKKKDKKGKKKDKKEKKAKKKEEKSQIQEEQEDGDGEHKKGGSKKKKGGGPIERRTDFYLHIAPSLPSLATQGEDEEAASPTNACDDDDEAALGRWVEEGCGLKLRGGPWGHQLELKVRTASAEAEAEAEAGAAGDDPPLHAERWVKLALPRVGGSSDEVVALPPRTVADLVTLHRAIAAAVVADDGDSAGGTWLGGGGWRGLVRAAGEFVRHHLSSSSSQHEEEVARERAQVAVARRAIGRRLMIAAGVAGGNAAPPDHRHPEPEPREPSALDGDSPPSPSNEPPPASASLADESRVEAETAAAAEEAPLCRVWQVDKARRQRNVKWPVARPKEKKAEAAAEEEGDGGDDDGDDDRVEVLVVEQTDISTFTYRANAAQGDEGSISDGHMHGRVRGYVNVCVCGGACAVVRVRCHGRGGGR